MSVALVASVFGAAPPVSAAAEDVQTFVHVSTSGTGSACSQSVPCSLEAAVAKVRTINSNMTGDIVVSLDDGRYELDETLELGASDSGTNGHQVRYVAADGADVTLSGGADFTTGWTLSNPTLGIYQRDAEGLDFRQLYVAEDRGVRARTPNLETPSDGGPFLIASGADPAARTYTVETGDIPAGDRSGTEFISTSWWYQNILRIDEIVADAGGVTSTVSFMEPERSIGFGQAAKYYDDSPYRLEGSLDFLDVGGEWFLDTGADTVYYKPKAGQAMNTTTITAPRLETLVRLAGTASGSVTDVTFSGITFAHTTWNEPSQSGLVTTQGVLPRPVTIETGHVDIVPAAVTLAFAERVTVENSRFMLLGAHGMQTVKATRDISIVSNDFDLIAGNAIHLDAYSKLKPTVAEQTSRILVGNNTISRFGRDYANGMGVAAFYLSDSIIEHNLITDGYYTGIQVGFQQRAHLDGGGGDNKIRYNEVSYTNRLIGDGGGIYTLGRQLGTEIHGNWVHHVVKGPWNFTTAPIAAVYLDNYTEYATVRDNVFQTVAKNIHLQTGVGTRNNVSFRNGTTGTGITAKAGPTPDYQPGVSNTIRKDTFNATSGTVLPGGWAVYSTAGSVSTVDSTPTDNRAVSITKGATGASAAILDVGTLSGVVNVDASYVLSDVSSWKSLLYMHAPGFEPGLGTQPVVSLIAYGGKLQVFDGSTYTELAPITAGSLYAVKIVADTTTQSYRVFINGTERGAGHPFRAPASDIGAVYVGIGSGHAGAFTFDNVAVTVDPA
ncbi:right-handed parallel beta-helix repeat-containing protein [Microbacterium sp. CIAB417]|uniref:right-handed parallel beta-helix repeat-containing protein n=1 Tax=Microbacterium sp. CIAB417 TaxID=2860287 RepID=UPI001FADFCA6|nr:right-handed parallel beta-helix repeat-containing protein [Microbacterium sp. CIAB417]